MSQATVEETENDQSRRCSRFIWYWTNNLSLLLDFSISHPFHRATSIRFEFVTNLFRFGSMNVNDQINHFVMIKLHLLVFFHAARFFSIDVNHDGGSSNHQRSDPSIRLVRSYDLHQSENFLVSDTNRLSISLWFLSLLPSLPNSLENENMFFV